MDVFLDSEEEKLIVYFEEAESGNEETVVYSHLYELTLDQEYEYLEVQVNDEPGELEIVLTDY